MLSKLLSKEFIEQYRTAFVDLLTKYADIKKDGKGYTITIDDKGFKAIFERERYEYRQLYRGFCRKRKLCNERGIPSCLRR
ncbi:MAG: hypothetical protein L6V93_18430 [Clostridiales bacterium]|nr:MAG: hypothetical protein L6V93_18430 [Clostridiales bacterium]